MRRLAAVLILALTPIASAEEGPKPLAVADVKRDAPVDFQKDVLPVLSANCLACHNRTKAKADLVLETPADMLKGGESGPAVVPKKADESLLLKLAAHRQDPVMPPKGNKAAAVDLTPEQLGLLKLWIEQGATGVIGVGAAPTLQWQPLPAGLNAIYAVALTPDGQYAACARGPQVHVYHLPTDRLVARLVDPQSTSQSSGTPGGAAHRDLVQSLAFSPDGQTLASGAYREVKLWRRPRDAKKFTTPSAGGAIASLAASPDGAGFATAGVDGTIHLWSSADGKPVHEFAGHSGAVSSVAFSPDGTKLASASADKTLRVWRVSDATTLAQGPLGAGPACIAFLAEGKQLASAGGDGVIRFWTVPEAPAETLTAVTELKGHEGGVVALAPVPGQPERLVSGGADGTVRVWDTKAGKAVRQMTHGGAVSSVAVRPDGKRLASAGANNVIKLWDPEGKPVAELKGEKEATEAAVSRAADVAFAASELAHFKSAAEAAAKRQAEQVERVKKAVAGIAEAEKALAEKTKAKAAQAEVKKAESAKAAAEDELRLAIKSAQQAADAAADAQVTSQDAERDHKQIEAELASLKTAAAAAEKPVRAVAFSPDNLLLASAGDDMLVHTWSAETGAAFDTRRGHAAAVSSLAFTGAGTLVSGGADGPAVAWDLSPRWTLEKQLGTGDGSSAFADRVTALGFTPDGKALVTGGGVPSREGEVVVWDLATGTLVKKLDRVHSDAVLALDVSADGKWLATGAADRFAKLTELATGRVAHAFEGHSGHVTAVALDRSGRTLASGSADNTAKVWDATTGEQRKTISGFEKEVTSLHFVGATDQFLATAGDARVRLLKPDGGEVRSFGGAAGFVYSAAVTRDGKLVAAGGEDGSLRLWEGASGKQTSTLAPPTEKP